MSAIRSLALHSQGLDTPPAGAGGPDDIYNTVDRIGWVQIDTLQMVHRSQYLVLWSRLGDYDPAQFDALLSGGGDHGTGRRLYEYWLHAACLVPLTEYRYSLPVARKYRERRMPGWYRHWIDEPGNRDLVARVSNHIRDNGPTRSADFDHGGPKRGSWWDWKPAKRALEYLYDSGELMIAKRASFQRVYDTRDRVLPDWVSLQEPSEPEATRHLLERSLTALGACDLKRVADYASLRGATVRPALEELVRDGTFVQVQAELGPGSVREFAIHRDNLEMLDLAADGGLTPHHTTFLSPFDNLFWAKGRDEQLWGFRQILECYKPEPERRWGYFCLPILHNDRMVGRFDPKLERKTGTLRLKKLYIEASDVDLDTLASSTAAAMLGFLRFHNAKDLVIEHSQPAEFGPMLLAAL